MRENLLIFVWYFSNNGINFDFRFVSIRNENPFNIDICLKQNSLSSVATQINKHKHITKIISLELAIYFVVLIHFSDRKRDTTMRNNCSLNGYSVVFFLSSFWLSVECFAGRVCYNFVRFSSVTLNWISLYISKTTQFLHT